MRKRAWQVGFVGGVAVLLAMGTAWAQAPAKPASAKGSATLQCRRASGPIVIDGKLDEACWQEAVVITGFTLAESGRLARTQAKARLLYDDTCIYLSGEIEDLDLYADLAGQDQKCWTNDVFELFMWPDESKTGYFEIQMTPNDATLDLFFAARGARQYETALPFTSGMKAKATTRGTLNDANDKDAGWTAEMAIPFAGLKGVQKPTQGTVWRGLVARYDYSVYLPPLKPGDAYCEASSSAALSAFSFHLLEDYNWIAFE